MGPSFKQELDATREAALAAAEKVVPVTASGGRIAVRFKPPKDEETRDALTGVVAIYRVGGALSRAQELQLLVDCCDEIGHYHGGEIHTFEHPDATGPLRFDASDPRWEDCENAHDCVAKLYNLDVQPLAVSGLCDALIDWLQGVDAEVQTRVEGKSEAPPADAS